MDDWRRCYPCPQDVSEPEPMSSMSAYRRYEFLDLRDALICEFRRLAPQDTEGWIHERLDILDTAICVCEEMQRYFTKPGRGVQV